MADRFILAEETLKMVADAKDTLRKTPFFSEQLYV